MSQAKGGKNICIQIIFKFVLYLEFTKSFSEQKKTDIVTECIKFFALYYLIRAVFCVSERIFK